MIITRYTTSEQLLATLGKRLLRYFLLLLGLACFLFASHFFVSSSSEGDDSIAFLVLRRMRGLTGGVAVGDVAVGDAYIVLLEVSSPCGGYHLVPAQ